MTTSGQYLSHTTVGEHILLMMKSSRDNLLKQDVGQYIYSTEGCAPVLNKPCETDSKTHHEPNSGVLFIFLCSSLTGFTPIKVMKITAGHITHNYVHVNDEKDS